MLKLKSGKWEWKIRWRQKQIRPTGLSGRIFSHWDLFPFMDEKGPQIVQCCAFFSGQVCESITLHLCAVSHAWQLALSICWYKWQSMDDGWWTRGGAWQVWLQVYIFIFVLWRNFAQWTFQEFGYLDNSWCSSVWLDNQVNSHCMNTPHTAQPGCNKFTLHLQLSEQPQIPFSDRNAVPPSVPQYIRPMKLA